jgi:hypothetical protein
MADLPQKLDLSPAEVSLHPMLQATQLPDAEDLLLEGERLAPSDLEAANLLLAASVLSQSHHVRDARLATALQLLAPLIANANPENTMGPQGATTRSKAMPNGWRVTLSSWPKFRYAWRESGGLKAIVAPIGASVVDPDDHRVELLDHITEMTPGETDPLQVELTKSFPPANIGFMITVIGLSFTGWNIYMNYKENQEIKAEIKARKKLGREVGTLRQEKKKRKKARIRKRIKNGS